MSKVTLDVADVARIEIHRHRIRAGIEDRHASLSLDVILPFVRVWMPVHLAHTAGTNGYQRGCDPGCDGEVATVGDPLVAAPGFSRRCGRCKAKDKGMRRSAPVLADCCSVRCQIAGQGALEDPEILQRDLGECL